MSNSKKDEKDVDIVSKVCNNSNIEKQSDHSLESGYSATHDAIAKVSRDLRAETFRVTVRSLASQIAWRGVGELRGS